MARTKKPETPSPEQLEVLRQLAADPAHTLYRMPGGFWTTRATPMRAHVGQSRYFEAHDVPAWHTGALTVRAMERRGWLCRTNVHPEEWRDERSLTEIGRALLDRVPSGL